MATMIYHMCPAAAWEAAVAAGEYRGTEDDVRDGFIHCSTAAQLPESARRHRAGQAGLLVLRLDAERLGGRVRWEQSRGGDLFPHVYGPLHPEDVLRIDPLPLHPDGTHGFPALE